jgi:hypothetical protein
LFLKTNFNFFSLLFFYPLFILLLTVSRARAPIPIRRRTPAR